MSLSNDENHYITILACLKLLEEFNADDCDDDEGREIPETINNPFVKSGLLGAIRTAASLMNKEKTPDTKKPA